MPTDLGLGDGAAGAGDPVEQPKKELSGSELEAVLLEQASMPGSWFDEKRERRAVKLALLKRRGKGPPKKGSGKRSKK